MNLILTRDPRETRVPYVTASNSQAQSREYHHRHQQDIYRSNRLAKEEDDDASMEVTPSPPSGLYSSTSEDSDHLIRLRLLTGWLEEMTFAEVAIVVGMDQPSLSAVLHGEAPLVSENYDRIDRMAEVTRLLRSLISHAKVGWWYRVSIPRFNGLSPLNLLRENRISDLEWLVKSYFDTSYT